MCTISAKAQNLVNAGIWQTYTEPLPIAQNPEIRGRLCNFTWKDLETAPGVWNWSVFDADLTNRTKDGLPVIFLVYTKEDAPDWLFTNGVTKVIEKDTRGNTIGYAPYYKDPEYKSYFKKMIIAVRKHVETLPSAVRTKITGVQACFGSTGDYISYKGEVPSQYALTSKEYSDLFREFTQYYYDEYKITNPEIKLLSNGRNNGKDDNIWVAANCPGWLQCGTISKGFQLNDELDKSAWLYNILNLPSGTDFIRARSEMLNSNTAAGWWKRFPYKNMFAIMNYAIHWGIDWSNQGGIQIADPLFDSSYKFFNKYAGQKEPAKSTNALCYLKDVLDASDAIRFPASTYGTVSRTSTSRYQNIVNKYASYGALLEDVKQATLEELDNLRSTGTNDVGWNLFPGNYERYLHQITPNTTSVGYWNVQSADPKSMYGKFARSFDVANNKKALYFDVDNAFLLNTALNGKYAVTIEVTYLDGPNGGWQLFYDSKTVTDKASVQVTCANTNTWKKATVTLTDAYFENRGPSTSDFSIRSTNSNNVMFSVVELSRPANFASSKPVMAINNTASATENTQNNSLIISPNPVTSQFNIELKNHGTITEIAVYNTQGKLLLNKKISTRKAVINRSEIGGKAGVYNIRVYAGKESYMGKVIVL